MRSRAIDVTGPSPSSSPLTAGPGAVLLEVLNGTVNALEPCRRLFWMPESIVYKKLFSDAILSHGI
jgi:hypothetical protein